MAHHLSIVCISISLYLALCLYALFQQIKYQFQWLYFINSFVLILIWLLCTKYSRANNKNTNKIISWNTFFISEEKSQYTNCKFKIDVCLLWNSGWFDFVMIGVSSPPVFRSCSHSLPLTTMCAKSWAIFNVFAFSVQSHRRSLFKFVRFIYFYGAGLFWELFYSIKIVRKTDMRKIHPKSSHVVTKEAQRMCRQPAVTTYLEAPNIDSNNNLHS